MASSLPPALFTLPADRPAPLYVVRTAGRTLPGPGVPSVGPGTRETPAAAGPADPSLTGPATVTPAVAARRPATPADSATAR